MDELVQKYTTKLINILTGNEPDWASEGDIEQIKKMVEELINEIKNENQSNQENKPS